MPHRTFLFYQLRYWDLGKYGPQRSTSDMLLTYTISWWAGSSPKFDVECPVNQPTTECLVEPGPFPAPPRPAIQIGG